MGPFGHEKDGLGAIKKTLGLAFLSVTIYSSFSIGFVLLIVFIVLKLIKVISWSWLWVLAPGWIPFVIVLLVILFVVMLAVISRLLKN